MKKRNLVSLLLVVLMLVSMASAALAADPCTLWITTYWIG